MKKRIQLFSLLIVSGLIMGCGDHSHGENGDHGHDHGSGQQQAHDDHGHAHGDGQAHEEADHGHHHGEEVPLGTFDIGGISVEAAQAHGSIEAGKEGHLIIKLPYNDKGETVVRAWIGVEDRTLSSVGKGVYAPSHDDYDIHTIAPNPLPEGAKWWIEIEKPDGMKAVGSIPSI